MKIKKILLLFILFVSIITKYAKTEKLKKENNKQQEIWEKTKLFKIKSLNGLKNFEKEIRTAIHEAGHLIVAKQLNGDVTKICIRNNNSGYIAHKNNLYNKNNKIMITLAGYTAEQIFFGESDSGSLNDINKAIQKIIKLNNLKNDDIHKIKKVLQNYINQTILIIFKNYDLIEKFAQTIIKQTPNESGEKILTKKEINEIYNSLTIQTSC